MHKLWGTLLCGVMACMTVAAADPPDLVKRMIIPGWTDSKVIVQPVGKDIEVLPGRFVAVIPPDTAKYRIFPTDVKLKRVPAGTKLIHHTRWDEDKSAEPKDYDFPDAKQDFYLFWPKADVTLQVMKNGEDGPEEFQTIRIKMLVGPQPPPPTPPGPVPPGPTPPGPNPPTPGTNPFGAVNGLHVLIVFDKKTKPLTPGQMSAIYGENVAKYLQEKCGQVVPPTAQDDGKAYRMWSFDSDLSRLPAAMKPFADAMKQPRTQNDWIYIGNGTGGTSEPLPTTEDKILELLKKYGG